MVYGIYFCTGIIFRKSSINQLHIIFRKNKHKHPFYKYHVLIDISCILFKKLHIIITKGWCNQSWITQITKTKHLIQITPKTATTAVIQKIPEMQNPTATTIPAATANLMLQKTVNKYHNCATPKADS